MKKILAIIGSPNDKKSNTATLVRDFLIIGSPVYEQFISAQTKTLFDRTFQWIHLQGLIGKPTITAVTSGGDGIVTAQGYLSIMLQFMGCVMVGHLKGIGQQPGFFPQRALYKEKYRGLAKNKESHEILFGNLLFVDFIGVFLTLWIICFQ